MLVDLPMADAQEVPNALTDRVGIVGGVMVNPSPSAVATRRACSSRCSEEAEYAVMSVEGNDLVIRVAPKRTGLAAKAPKAKSSPNRPSQGPARVRDVRFEQSSDEDRVVIELGESAEYAEPKQ